MTSTLTVVLALSAVVAALALPQPNHHEGHEGMRKKMIEAYKKCVDEVLPEEERSAAMENAKKMWKNKEKPTGKNACVMKCVMEKTEKLKNGKLQPCPGMSDEMKEQVNACEAQVTETKECERAVELGQCIHEAWKNNRGSKKNKKSDE